MTMVRDSRPQGLVTGHRNALGVAVVAGIVVLGAGAPATQSASRQPAPDYVPPVVQSLSATTVRTFDAPEAGQGVAVDATHFFAVDNTVIAKYERATGHLVGRWTGPRNGLVRHLNSCLVLGARLWCANSNYPQVPMGSSVEVFDPASLDHVESLSLGMRDEGSLTWADRYRGGWLAGFAHYDGNGGVAFKRHEFSSVVTFDADWRRTGGWLLPASVLERLAPHATSGGAIGPDGWLYLLGHDRPELYVVGRPPMGPTLIHLATIAVEAEGQAFSWAPGASRAIFTVDRRNGRIREIALPGIVTPSPKTALPFR
jgi:hypothetical protein